MPGDDGGQTITLRFFDPVETPTVNKRQKDIVPTGIYKGGYLARKNDSEVYLSVLVCEIQDDSGNHDQVRVETASVVTITGVGSGAPYIVLRWTYTGVAVDDYMEFAAVSSPDTYELVVGKATFSAGPMDGTFNYAERSNPSVKDLFLKVEPEQTPSKYVRVRAGVVQVGNNKVLIADSLVGPFITTATKTGAVYISDLGVVTISSDFTYAGQLVLAEIAITSGMTEITATDITDVRSFLTCPLVPDGTHLTRSSTGKLTTSMTPVFYAGEGSITFPNGLIQKLGRTAIGYTSQGSYSINWPVPFPNACSNVQLTLILSAADPGATGDTWPQILSYTKTQLNFYLQNSNTVSFRACDISYSAIGY